MNAHSEDSQRSAAATPLLVGLFFVSLAILAYEVALTRVLAIAQWHHFAYMIISVALLGFGASGTLIAVLQRAFRQRLDFFLWLFWLLFAVACPVCFALSQLIPFDAMEITIERRQFLYLAEYYLVLFVPFLFGATVVGLCFLRLPNRVGAVYGANLLGSAAGALAVIGLLYLAEPRHLAALITLVALVGGTYLCLAVGTSRSQFFASFMVGILALAATTEARLNISQWKALPGALRLPGAKVLAERHGPLGLVHLVGADAIHEATGMSIASPYGASQEAVLIVDAGGASPITPLRPDFQGARYLGYLPRAAPYAILDKPKVLVLGAGGGADVVSALLHGASAVDAVELNPQVIELLRDDFPGLSGGLYSDPRVQVHTAEARGFVRSTPDRYDLVQLAPMDAYAASAAGVYALSETYVYTTQAIWDYWRVLSDDGVLAVTRWLKTPPRDCLKLFATAVKAFSPTRGEGGARERLFFLRGSRAATLLVKRDAFWPGEIAALRDFCDDRQFDTIYFPGIQREHANRHNVLEAGPLYYEACQRILFGDREAFFRDYDFAIEPATDDRPYFFHSLRWRSLPLLKAHFAVGNVHFIEWGYIILVATLAQAIPISLVLILVPLVFLRRTKEEPAAEDEQAASKLRIVLYFACLGFAFIFIEMGFIQKSILFLAHPTYAVALVIGSFLLFAGLGSLWGRRLVGEPRRRTLVAVWAIVCIASAYLLVHEAAFELLLGQPLWLKGALAVLVIAPLAFFMGMPFPTGLQRVTDAAPRLVPWAWGINGCASVIGAVLAALLAMAQGFSVVIFIALGLYLIASAAFTWRARCTSPPPAISNG
ncbi:MAG: SAM-dependent methyltransferase [Armatimonadota bacterium]